MAALIILAIISVIACIIAKKRTSEAYQLRHKLAESELRLAVANERISENNILQQQWKEQFEQLSAKALRDNNEAFLLMAQQSFSSMANDAKSGFGNAVKPIEDILKLFDTKLQTLETQRQHAYSSLSEQLKLANQANIALQEETNNLCNALRKPDVRGQWGEMQLRRTVELAGMQEHVDFEEQAQTNDSDGNIIRPDMIIKLPNARTIVVDAKTPLTGYLEATSAQSISEKNAALATFSKQIKRHIESLSDKNYWSQFQSCPEFVVLFLPGENFLSDAFRANADLLEFGVSKRVILATPTTLIALLKAISYGWKQERLADEARDIITTGTELYKRLSKFMSHFNKMGKTLSDSVQAFNNMRASAESRLIPQAKRLQALGTEHDEVSLTNTIDIVPRIDNASSDF